MAVNATLAQEKEPLIQRFRKGRGLGISTFDTIQGNSTLIVLSEIDRVQCLVDHHSADLDFTLQWTLLVPSNKRLTCRVIPVALGAVQFLGVLDEHEITLWDPNADEFGVVNYKSVLQVPYSVISVSEVVLHSRSLILVILSTGYQILETTSFDIVFSYILQDNCKHICSQVTSGSVFPLSLGLNKESDYFMILGVVNYSQDKVYELDNRKASKENIFIHIFNEECCKLKAFEWNMRPPMENSTIQSFVSYKEVQNDEIESFHLCILWSCGILEFRMVTFNMQVPIVLRRITLSSNQPIHQNSFLVDMSNDYFGIVLKESLEIWHKKWKLCLRILNIGKELGIAKSTSIRRCLHLGDDHFCIYGCFVNGLSKWSCELTQLSLSQVVEMKRVETRNIQDRTRGQMFSEDVLEALSISDNDTQGGVGILEACWEKEKEWMSYLEQDVYASNDILKILQNPQLSTRLENSSSHTSEHQRLYEKPSYLLINTILNYVIKALKDGDLSYTAVLELLVKRHWIDYSMLRDSLLSSLEGNLNNPTKNPVLFPFLWKNSLFSLCLECLKHIVDLSPIEIIFLIQQVSNNMQSNSNAERETLYLQQLLDIVWERPLSTKEMISSLELLPFRDVILQLYLFEKELENVLHSSKSISKAWIAWIALILDTNMFALIMDSKGVQHLTNIYEKVEQLEQLSELVVSVEPLVRSLVERQQHFLTNTRQSRTHWVEYYSFTL